MVAVSITVAGATDDGAADAESTVIVLTKCGSVLLFDRDLERPPRIVQGGPFTAIASGCTVDRAFLVTATGAVTVASLVPERSAFPSMVPAPMIDGIDSDSVIGDNRLAAICRDYDQIRAYDDVTVPQVSTSSTNYTEVDASVAADAGSTWRRHSSATFGPGAVASFDMILPRQVTVGLVQLVIRISRPRRPQDPALLFIVSDSCGELAQSVVPAGNASELFDPNEPLVLRIAVQSTLLSQHPHRRLKLDLSVLDNVDAKDVATSSDGENPAWGDKVVESFLRGATKRGVLDLLSNDVHATVACAVESISITVAHRSSMPADDQAAMKLSASTAFHLALVSSIRKPAPAAAIPAVVALSWLSWSFSRSIGKPSHGRATSGTDDVPCTAAALASGGVVAVTALVRSVLFERSQTDAAKAMRLFNQVLVCACGAKFRTLLGEALVKMVSTVPLGRAGSTREFFALVKGVLLGKARGSALETEDTGDTNNRAATLKRLRRECIASLLRVIDESGTTLWKDAPNLRLRLSENLNDTFLDPVLCELPPLGWTKQVSSSARSRVFDSNRVKITLGSSSAGVTCVNSVIDTLCYTRYVRKRCPCIVTPRSHPLPFSSLHWLVE